MVPTIAQSWQCRNAPFPQLILPHVETDLFIDALGFTLFPTQKGIIAETSCFLPLGNGECDNMVQLWLTFADPIPTPNSDLKRPIPAVKEHVQQKEALPTFIFFVAV